MKPAALVVAAAYLAWRWWRENNSADPDPAMED